MECGKSYPMFMTSHVASLSSIIGLVSNIEKYKLFLKVINFIVCIDHNEDESSPGHPLLYLDLEPS